ncbi:MAG TPA: hypothetical protein VGM87_06710 [Roseomonas sp.]
MLLAAGCLILLAYILGVRRGRHQARREIADNQRLGAAVAGVVDRRRH